MAFLQLKTFSNALRTKTNIQIILPTPLASEVMDRDILQKSDPAPASKQFGMRYYEPETRCPVLYLLHGTYGDEGDWTRFSMIETYAQEYNIAVVMPDAENSCYRDMPNGAPQYYTYITEELPRMIQWMFPVSTKREDTFIAGLSMGGSGAFKIGMSRPAQYGCVASLSGGFCLCEQVAQKAGSVWSYAFAPGETVENTIDDPIWLSTQLVQNGVDYPRLYLCCGTEDFVYPQNLKMKKHLDSIGFRYTYHEQPGLHDWHFWNDEIQRILAWLPIQKR